MKGTLTTAGVRKLRPKGRTYEVTCSRLPGFVVRVLPSGRKVFLVRHLVDGRDTRVRIGPWSEALTVDEARQQALAILNDAAEPMAESAPVVRGPGSGAGRRTAPARRDAPKDMPRARERLGPDLSQRGDGTTIRELCERYEREFMPVYLKKSTATNYRRLIRDHIIPTFGDRHFESVRRREAKAMHTRLSDRPGLADYVLCVLGSLYTRIINDWELSEMRNPTAGIRRFGSRKVERFLTPEERRRVDEVFESAQSIPRGRPGHVEPFSVWAIKLLMLTGLRRDEILTLAWPMVDWQHACFHLPDTKTGQRSVLISDEVIALLREIQEGTGHPTRGLVVRGRRGTKLSAINQTWARIRDEAGIPDVRLHDLRHSFASDALMAGVPLAIVGEMLGHKQPNTTKRYAHLANNVVRDALVTATARIVSATQPRTVESRRARPRKPDFKPLRDAQWAQIAPLVDATRPRGGSPVDLRGVVDGIRWKIQRGARWRDLPEEYGTPTTCWRWHKRWSESGVWEQVLAKIAG